MLFDGIRKEDTHLSPLVYAGKNSMWVYGLHFFFLEFWFLINNTLPNYRSLISVVIKLSVTIIIMTLSLITARLLNILKDQVLKYFISL